MQRGQTLALIVIVTAVTGAAQAGNLMPGSTRMFNPQPEPPAQNLQLPAVQK